MDSTVYELIAPGDLAQRTLALPAPQPHEILATTVYSAVSTGTELAAWKGLPPLRPSKVYPRLMGYCNVARIVSTGSDVQGMKAGDHVITHQSHRSAFVCPASSVLHMVRGLEPEALKPLAATYLYHLGYAALLAANFTPGHLVGIVGMGALGICAAQLSKAFCGNPLLFTDQPQFAQQFGHLGETLSKAMSCNIDAMTLGMGGVDIVVNTSNQWIDHELAMRVARKGGTVVCLGFPGRGEPAPQDNPLDSRYFYDKQLTVKHCGHVTEMDLDAIDVRFTLKRNMAFLAGLIQNSVVDPSDILSFEAPWHALGETYETLAGRPAGIYTALVNWE